VQLGDVSATFAQIAVVGPKAARVVGSTLEGASEDTLTALTEHGNIRANYVRSPAIVTRTTDAGVPGFDLYVDHGQAVALMEALASAGLPALELEVSEAIRIEGGVPLFHRDMDEETIPLEAGIESRAISFTKGCYVGQEVIIRVLHRGHGRVARKLVGLRLTGDLVPAGGTEIRAADRAIGQITSSAWSPALRSPIALAYIHRDFISPGTTVTVDGAAADVTALPFV
jgi:folate-binding protein YgfZ